MKSLTFALAASLPLAALAEAGIAGAANEAPLKAGETVSVSVDKGLVTVEPGAPGKLSYTVEFKPDRGFWERLGLGGGTPAGCAECSVDYTPAKGLSVRTGKGVSALVKATLPAGQALDLAVDVGTVRVGRLTGTLTAKLETGTLDYDGRDLPAGACVDAVVKVGAVENRRDAGCKSTPAALRVKTGTISVR